MARSRLEWVLPSMRDRLSTFQAQPKRAPVVPGDNRALGLNRSPWETPTERPAVCLQCSGRIRRSTYL